MITNRCTVILSLAFIGAATNWISTSRAETIHSASPTVVLHKIVEKLNGSKTIDATFISSVPHSPLVHLLFRRPNLLRVSAKYPSGLTVIAICTPSHVIVTNSKYPRQYMEFKVAYGSAKQISTVVGIAPMFMLSAIDPESNLGIKLNSSDTIIEPLRDDPSLMELVSTKVVNRSPLSAILQKVIYQPGTFRIEGLSMVIKADGTNSGWRERVVNLALNAPIPVSVFHSALPEHAVRVSKLPFTFVVLPKILDSSLLGSTTP